MTPAGEARVGPPREGWRKDAGMEATLLVYNKHIDLVAETAGITLRDKMGYAGRLLALRRFDFFRFMVDTTSDEEYSASVDGIRKALASTSTFYNRNKHNYFLEFRNGGETIAEGVGLERLERDLADRAVKSLEKNQIKDLDIHDGRKKVIFSGEPVFLGSILVEEMDHTRKEGLGARLGDALGTKRVEFLDAGVLWWLLVSAHDADAAGRLVDEIAVSRRRDRGLLLNPNYQEYKLLGIKELMF